MPSPHKTLAALKTAKSKKSKKARRFLSTGSTLLNLALTDNPARGFMAGGYYNLVGDSNSGKTFLTLTCFAESRLDPYFSGYDLYFDNPEDGAQMDFARYFGKAVAKAVKSPGKGGEPSRTVEEFYDNLHAVCAKGRPFIYVLDSENALSSESELKADSEGRKARASGGAQAGFYTDGKAKYHSRHLRAAIREVKRCKGILIIISQTRDAMGSAGFATKTMAGGRSLKFYATSQIWTSERGKISLKVAGRSRSVGMLANAAVRKNRITGKDRAVSIPFYFEHGLDDTLGQIDWLLLEGHWKMRDKKIRAKEFGFSGPRRELAALIDNGGRREELAGICGSVWKSIESQLSLNRKSKYA